MCCQNTFAIIALGGRIIALYKVDSILTRNDYLYALQVNNCSESTCIIYIVLIITRQAHDTLRNIKRQSDLRLAFRFWY